MSGKVAVIIPTYKRSSLVKRAIHSVESAALYVGLNRHALEIMVIDDGHDDATMHSVNMINNKSNYQVRYDRNPKGSALGPAAARNYGVSISTGELLYWLDDDDEFCANRFEVSLPLLTSGRYNVIMECALRVDDHSGRQWITGPGPGIVQKPFYYLLMGGEKTHVATGATAFTREIFNHVGGMDEMLRYGEDGELLLRLCLAGKVRLASGEPVVIIHRHSENSSRAENLHYCHTMQLLATLYRKAVLFKFCKERRFLKGVIRGNLDYSLSTYRQELSYSDRVRSGLQVLFYFPISCLSLNNVKTLWVWLTRRQP
jgi:glycosyltransferase involved in cell wall biosynthesis